MSKNKKRKPAKKPRQPIEPQYDQLVQKTHNGANRQQKRNEARAPQRATSHKPVWLRILILIILGVMFLGFFLLPLVR